MPTTVRRWALAVALALGPALAAPAQASASNQAKAPDSERRSTRTIAILGASASAGFSDQLITATTPEAREHNRTFNLRQALEPLFPAETLEFKDCSNAMMFMQPERVGKSQVQRALAAEPDAVLAIDFLFWFGYSVRGGDRASRLALQQRGLAELAKIDRPLVLGDYPEMRDIDPRMLAPHAIPDADTLRALNTTLQAWVRERPQVRLFSLGDRLRELRERNREVVLGDERLLLEPADLLQTDRLHVTRLGMAVLASEISTVLVAAVPGDPLLHAEARVLPDVLRRLDLIDAARQAGALAVPAATTGK